MILSNKAPRVSIGIPIYSGEIYLEETLESLLSQTFKDYEIIITDNNPGGIAEEIATRYAEKYSFIQYIKHKKKIGALQNWNSIIQYVRGEYFAYVGGHDLLSNDFLAKTTAILDRYNTVVLAYAPTIMMDSKGMFLDDNIGLLDTSNSSLIQRFNQVLWSNSEAQYGLIRTDIIKRTRLQKEIIGSGAVWLSEISIFGEFRVCNEIVRYRRTNREPQTKEEQLTRYHTTLFSKKRIRLLPHWRIPIQYLRVAFIGKMSVGTRIRLILNAGISSLLRYTPNMIYDIKSLIIRIPRMKFY